MRGGAVPNAHKAQKHRKIKAAEVINFLSTPTPAPCHILILPPVPPTRRPSQKKANAKAKKHKGHKEL